jgi:hypothetical protein
VQKHTDALYHLETVKDWQGRDVDLPVYDIPVAVRIAIAVARLAEERPPRVTWVVAHS